MRVALVLAAALPIALGACKVDLDGAPCRVAGSTADCPAGQACGPPGPDGLGRCSTYVGDCVAAGTFCAPGDERGGHRCAGSRLETCVPGDDCGAWALAEDCGELFCDAARATCRCPDPPAGAWAVDPTPLPPGSHAPSGAATPAACRLRSLTQALGLAKVLVSNDPTATATVTAVGGAAGTTVAFSAAGSGEAFPLEIPGRVTLTSDAASSGATYELLFDDSASAAAPVTLGAGATLARFAVRNQAGGTEDRALILDCGTATDAVSLDGVLLDGRAVGGNRLDEGIRVDGPCGLSATALDVRGMARAGIELTQPAATVTLSGGTIGGADPASRNGTGISVQDGTLVASTTRVEGNEHIGIDANASFTGTLVVVKLSGVKVVRNGDTGIAVRNAMELAIRDTTVFGNSAATSWGEGLYTPRRCGGVVLWGDPPAAGLLEFQHNRVYANSGDQVVVLGSSTATWSLQPPGAQPACTASGQPLFNTFSCYDASAPPNGQVSYRGLVALSASASVLRAVWLSETPSAAVDFHVYGAGAVTLTPWCPPDPSLRCTSEDPVLP